MKTMIEILKNRLPTGAEMLEVKEYSSKYKVKIKFEEETTRVDCEKTVVPGYQNDYIDKVIATAMSTIYINKGELQKAREWLNKAIKSN